MRAFGSDRSRSFLGGAALVLLLAFALRIVAALRYRLIEHDGAYYADMARSLLAGDFSRGWSTVWPPLEPLGIAAFAAVARAAGAPGGPELLEAAGRALSVACGAALVVPVWLLARRLLPRRLAVVAVVFVAVHARLIQYSGAALTEAVFTLLLASAVAAWVHRRAAWSGVFFGLAYLARPEGLLIAALFAVAATFPEFSPRRGRLAFALALVATTAPHVLLVSLELGRPSLGEKGDYNFWRAHQAASAQHFVEPKLLADRVGDLPSIAVRDQGRDREFAPLALILREPAAVMGKTAANLGRIVVSTYPVALHPIFLLLLLLGLWRLPYFRWRWILLLLAALPFLYAPFSIDRRFFVPAIPFALLLSARGCWIGARGLAHLRVPQLRTAGWVALLATIISAGQVSYFLVRGRALDEAPELREAGLWLRAHGPNRPVVEAHGPWVGFYANGSSIQLPEVEPEAVVARARARGAGVLAVDARSMAGPNSPLRPLLDPARAPAGLRFLHRIDRPDTVVLYAVEDAPVRMLE